MNNVEKLALEIFKSFITTENKYQFENESYSNRYIDLAVELAQKIDDKTNEDKIIYCEDVVIVSINDNEPERFLLTWYDDDDNNTIEYVDETPKMYDTSKIKIVRVETPLGREILGRHVNETFTYKEYSEEITVKILGHKRTKYSYQLSKYELDAELREKEKII